MIPNAWKHNFKKSSPANANLSTSNNPEHALIKTEACWSLDEIQKQVTQISAVGPVTDMEDYILLQIMYEMHWFYLL